MITTDQLLIEFNKFGINRLDTNIPIKDRKILSSLARQITHGNFLTENQGNLLVKIFQENKLLLPVINDNQAEVIDTPRWGERFRVIDQVRCIYTISNPEPALVVEYSFNKKIKQIFSDFAKVVQGQIQTQGRYCVISLTEKNIYLIVKELKKYNFQIEPKIWNFYQEISKILQEQKTPFEIFSIDNEKYLKNIFAEIGTISKNNLTLLNDRRLAFQYQIFEKNPEKTLTNDLANRSNTRVYVNSQSYTLDDLFRSLVDLRRLPTLIIFNGHDIKETTENFEKLEKTIKNSGLNNVGIYFRFDNTTESNKIFNNKISSLNFNQRLDKTTEIVGIVNNKLPKFLINSDWYPKSVISFSNNFKNNKTSIYCDAVDLIVYYNTRKPLGEDIDDIL
jgi:hypothetical protein